MRTRPLAPGARWRAVVAGLAFCSACGADREERPPNVVLITIDTLRADHLGAYGAGPGASPEIDRFAAGATLFENATAQAPHTLPSIPQMMTSTYRQGVRVEPATPTLAERLAAAGYRTAAIVENAHFESSRDAAGLVRGFDEFHRNTLVAPGDVVRQHWRTNTPADAITARARRWLVERGDARPFFLWLHYFDPHDPYAPPFDEEAVELSWSGGPTITGDVRATRLFNRRAAGVPPASERERETLRELYRAEVRYVDRSLGELLRFLRSRELFDDALIVLSSDHGESLGEHGFWNHGVSLHQPEIHVPLVVKLPGQRSGARRTDPAELIDVMPTILGRLGVAPGAGADGVDLLAAEKQHAFVFWKGGWVARTARWKLMRLGADLSLYDLRDDPGELRDVSADRPEVVEALAGARLERLRERGHDEATLEEAARETLEALRSLGYVR